MNIDGLIGARFIQLKGDDAGRETQIIRTNKATFCCEYNLDFGHGRMVMFVPCLKKTNSAMVVMRHVGEVVTPMCGVHLIQTCANRRMIRLPGKVEE